MISTTSDLKPISDYTEDDVEAVFTLSEAHKRYNYITLTKNLQIRLPVNQDIRVLYYPDKHQIQTHTHRTQANRCDGLKEILAHYEAGDEVHISWNARDALLTFY